MFETIVTQCIFIIPIGFRLFAIAEFSSIVNNRKKYSIKWDRGLKMSTFIYYFFNVCQNIYSRTQNATPISSKISTI